MFTIHSDKKRFNSRIGWLGIFNFIKLGKSYDSSFVDNSDTKYDNRSNNRLWNQKQACNQVSTQEINNLLIHVKCIVNKLNAQITKYDCAIFEIECTFFLSFGLTGVFFYCMVEITIGSITEILIVCWWIEILLVTLYCRFHAVFMKFIVELGLSYVILSIFLFPKLRETHWRSIDLIFIELFSLVVKKQLNIIW